MKLKFLQRFFYISILALIPAQLLAEVTGYGAVANNLMVPVTIVSNALSSIAIIVGITSLFAALLKYLQHRENPLAHPISVVITLLLIGIALVLLPLVYKLTVSGIPFSLHIF